MRRSLLNLLYFCFISAVLLAVSLECSDDNVSPHPVFLTTTLLSDTAQTKSDPYSIPWQPDVGSST